MDVSESDLLGLVVYKSLETHQAANDGAQVENDPEQRNVSSLGLLAGVGHHDDALGRPQTSSASAQKSTGKDNKPIVLSVVVAKKRCYVDAVSQTTKGQSSLDTKSVDNSAGEET